MKSGVQGSRVYRSELNSDETRIYWKSLHETLRPNESGLGRISDGLLRPVCHPDAPYYVNRFVHAMQREALSWALGCVPLSMVQGKALDLGCGTGRWSRFLCDRGAQVTGIDLAPEAVQAARMLVPEAQFACSDLLNMEFETGEFDYAISVTVLQHLPYEDQAEAVIRLRRSLRDGGYFVLLENVRDRGYHVFARTFEGWIRLIQSGGFRVEAVRGYEFVPLLQLERFARKALSHFLVRGIVDATLPEFKQQRTFRQESPIRFIHRNLVLRGAVVASIPIEMVAKLLLPRRFATHGAFVFVAT
jgi:SAM-dependent methyltransferase